MLRPSRKHSMGEPAPVKKKRTYPESDVQKKVVAWIRERPDWMVLRLENAQQRTPGAVARDKAMGMKPGAPDLVLLYRKRVLWMELKSETGTLSGDQSACHFELLERGQQVLVGHGYWDSIAKLEAFAAMCDS